MLSDRAIQSWSPDFFSFWARRLISSHETFFFCPRCCVVMIDVLLLLLFNLRVFYYTGGNLWGALLLCSECAGRVPRCVEYHGPVGAFFPSSLDGTVPQQQRASLDWKSAIQVCRRRIVHTLTLPRPSSIFHKRIRRWCTRPLISGHYYMEKGGTSWQLLLLCRYYKYYADGRKFHLNSLSSIMSRLFIMCMLNYIYYTTAGGGKGGLHKKIKHIYTRVSIDVAGERDRP